MSRHQVVFPFAEERLSQSLCEFQGNDRKVDLIFWNSRNSVGALKSRRRLGGTTLGTQHQSWYLFLLLLLPLLLVPLLAPLRALYAILV